MFPEDYFILYLKFSHRLALGVYNNPMVLGRTIVLVTNVSIVTWFYLNQGSTTHL